MRYQGGKHRNAKFIVPILKEVRGSSNVMYLEPFVGGGNIFHLMDNPKIGSDVDKDVVSLWSAVSKGWLPPKRRSPLSPRGYNNIKSRSLLGTFEDEALAGMIAFGCSICGRKWGGLGHVSVTRPNAPDFYESSRRAVIRQSEGFVGSCVECRDYAVYDARYCYNRFGPMLVYCDPPYHGTLGYGHSFNTAEFWSWVYEMSKFHAVFVSEYSAPDFMVCVWSRERLQGINLKHRVEKLWGAPMR